MRHVFLKSVLAGTLVLVAAAPRLAMARPGDGSPVAEREPQEKSYVWSGRARVISDITGKETWWPGSGVVRAGSREQAMEMAVEAMKAHGSIAGRVVDAHVSLLN